MIQTKTVFNSIFTIPAENINTNPSTKIINDKTFCFKDYQFILPESKLFYLQNIQVNSDYVFDEKDHFLNQFSWFGNDTRSYMKYLIKAYKSYLLNNFNKDPVILSGNSVYLCSTWGQYNISHFLLDGITRLYSYQSYGIDMSKIDHILIQKPSDSYFVNKIIDKLKIDQSKIKIVNDSSYYLCENLFISELIGGIKRQYKKILNSFFAPMRSNKEIQKNKNIFIMRNNHRTINNIQEVLDLLKKYNFTVLHKYPTDTDLEEANIIISPHSAVLSKLVFTSSKSKILELIPSHHPYAYYYEICRVLDLNYDGMVCYANQNDTELEPFKNFNVNIQQLNTWIGNNI